MPKSIAKFKSSRASFYEEIFIPRPCNLSTQCGNVDNFRLAARVTFVYYASMYAYSYRYVLCFGSYTYVRHPRWGKITFTNSTNYLRYKTQHIFNPFGFFSFFLLDFFLASQFSFSPLQKIFAIFFKGFRESAEV